MYKNNKIGVVVAAYNEQHYIEEVIKTIPSFVDMILLINDCSTDSTEHIIARIHDPRLMVINHKNRLGAGGANITGYKRACQEEIDIIAVMNGDGQMDPSILYKILDPIADGKADYSKGDRLSIPRHRHAMPAWRLVGNFLLTYLIRVASGYWNMVDPMNGYTAISRHTLEKIHLDEVERGFAFETDLLVKLNLVDARVMNVPMPARYRDEKSKIVYSHFILNTSWVIFKDFILRIWYKYIRVFIGNLLGLKK